jgi:hypothetical protein
MVSPSADRQGCSQLRNNFYYMKKWIGKAMSGNGNTIIYFRFDHPAGINESNF